MGGWCSGVGCCVVGGERAIIDVGMHMLRSLGHRQANSKAEMRHARERPQRWIARGMFRCLPLILTKSLRL